MTMFRAQGVRLFSLTRQRPVVDGVRLGALICEHPQELLDGPLVPFVQRAIGVVHLFFCPSGELTLGVLLRPLLKSNPFLISAVSRGCLLELPAGTSF